MGREMIDKLVRMTIAATTYADYCRSNVTLEYKHMFRALDF